MLSNSNFISSGTGSGALTAPTSFLLLRRHRGSVQLRSEEDAGLRQVIVDALVEGVTAWATDCPVLLVTAAALNRAKGD